MTALEETVARFRCDVQMRQLELQQAELELTHGDRFMSEAKEKYGKLKIAVEIAKAKLKVDEIYLEKAESDHQKGFVDEVH